MLAYRGGRSPNLTAVDVEAPNTPLYCRKKTLSPAEPISPKYGFVHDPRTVIYLNSYVFWALASYLAVLVTLLQSGLLELLPTVRYEPD